MHAHVLRNHNRAAAAVTLIQDINADSPRALAAYLETYAAQQAGVEYCVPIVTQAAHCFAAHDYAQPFVLILQAYCVLTAVRAANPQLPPVRGLGASFARLTCFISPVPVPGYGTMFGTRGLPSRRQGPR
jgi:hypothetical protein